MSSRAVSAKSADPATFDPIHELTVLAIHILEVRGQFIVTSETADALYRAWQSVDAARSAVSREQYQAELDLKIKQYQEKGGR